MPESFQDEEIQQKAFDPRLMRRLLTYLKPYRGRVAFLVAVTIALAGVHLWVPRILKDVIDGPLASGKPDGLLHFGLFYLGALILIGVLQVLQGTLTTGLGLRVTRDLREQVFSHLQRLSLAFYDRHPVGRLMTRVMGDVDALNELLSTGIVTALSDVVLLGGIVGVMLVMHPPLALVTLSVLLVLVPCTLAFRRKARDLYREIRLRVSRLNIAMQENITGMRIVQLFNREDRNFREFDAINDEHTRWWQRAIIQHNIFQCTIMFLQVLAMALIIGYGGTRILSGDTAITIGLMVAFIRYGQLFFRPIIDLSEKYNILLAAMASSERLFQLLDTDERIREPAAATPLGRAKGAVAFEGVRLAYREGTEEADVLKGVSFRVAPGERVALVGHTGAGKTSVISCLYRFYEIREGRILLDGIDTRDLALSDLRRQLALVLQEPFLFSGTIAENIRLGRADITDAQVEAACKAVHIHDFILSRGGYGAEVQERGGGFSEGERQLLSFARALAFDTPLLLLDEATANVDSHTEARIQEALQVLMKGRTCFVIAHRLSTIRDADRILVFHHGALREEGTHAALLAKGGLYAKLHAMQFKPAAAQPQPSPRPEGEERRGLVARPGS
jgi:ATP-binding cassette subfamily B protein